MSLKINLAKSWLNHLEDEFSKTYMIEIKEFLRNQISQRKTIFPPGKEIFNLRFIPRQLLKKSSCDILATLTELTAICIAKSLRSQKKFPHQVIVCGGRLKNTFLI